ncbi:hypothetical protein EMCRGX_G008630 [Ephydatia muelleri]
MQPACPVHCDSNLLSMRTALLGDPSRTLMTLSSAYLFIRSLTLTSPLAPRPYGGANSQSPIPQLEQDVGMGSAEQDALTMKESPLKKLDTVLPKAAPIMGVVAK